MQQLAGAIKKGPVVVQTETVYGIACLPREEDVRRIFQVKKRPVSRNLPVIVDSLASARGLGVEVPEVAECLAVAFWPGALTLAFGFPPKQAAPEWLEGRVEVAVRVPAVDELRGLATLVGPYLMTSANLHGRVAATSHDEVRQMFPEFEIFDWGVTTAGASSTLVNVRLRPPVIERRGAIVPEAIRIACPDSDFIVRSE